jgi:hypothetical protein
MGHPGSSFVQIPSVFLRWVGDQVSHHLHENALSHYVGVLEVTQTNIHIHTHIHTMAVCEECDFLALCVPSLRD